MLVLKVDVTSLSDLGFFAYSVNAVCLIYLWCLFVVFAIWVLCVC